MIYRNIEASKIYSMMINYMETELGFPPVGAKAAVNKGVWFEGAAYGELPALHISEEFQTKYPHVLEGVGI